MKKLLRTIIILFIAIVIFFLVKYFGSNFVMVLYNSGDAVDYSIDTPVKKYETVKSEDEVLYALDRMQNNLQPVMLIRYSNIDMEQINLDKYLQTNNNIAKVNITYSKEYININLEYRLWYQVSRLHDSISVKKHVSKEALELAQIADEIIDEIITNTMIDYEKEKAVHDYIVLNTKYGTEVGEAAYTITGVLQENTAVCQGYAETFKMFMDLLGIECHLVLGEASEDHEWNIVRIDGAYYHVDVTWDDPTPDSEGEVSYLYFNVPDYIIAEDHKWETDNYPICDSTKHNYFKKAGVWINSLEELEKKIYSDYTNNKKEIEIFCGFELEKGTSVSELAIAFLQDLGYYGKIKYAVKENYCKLMLE
jgi:hypothetical protein